MNTSDFKIGDTVAVIDDTITGIVIDINNSIITIRDNNGFSFNYKQNELVKSFDFKESFIDNHKNFSKEKSIPVKVNKKKTNHQEVLEVDLHIHQITKSNKHLSNFGMLSRQVNYAEQKIIFAIKNNIQKVVFIHGVGQGVLKSELYQLFKKYKITVNDANFKKYGYGATEIYIYKNVN